MAKALSGRSAIVTPEQRGSVVVFDKQSDEQNPKVLSELGARLSRELDCAVLAVLNHDDDILWYQLYLAGGLADEYDSAPGYFDAAEEPSAPAGGDAKRLCGAFGSVKIAEVDNVLRKSAFSDGGYVFEIDRHAELARLVGIQSFSVDAGYRYVTKSEVPAGLKKEDLVKVT